MRRAIVAAVVLAAAAACGTKSSPPATLPRETLLDPNTCKQCHIDHFNDWSGSMHAYASDDPVFLAMNKRGQRETGGQLGSFCVNCHAPMAVREGATTDGQNLATVDPKLHGVTCFFCHSVDSVTGTHDNPLVLATDLVMRGPFDDPVANTAHQATYLDLLDRDRLESATLCGPCHDIQTSHGAALERTYAEWQASVFAKPPAGATCGQCHMNQSANLVPIAQAPNVFARRKHEHTFAAIDTALTPFPQGDQQKAAVKALLDTTLQTALCVSNAGGVQIRVLLDNVASGHDFPSGAAQDRRVFTEVIGTNAGAMVYQSGVVADGADVTKPVNDPDLWLMRDCIFDDTGAEVKMFWQAASTEGNELPAQATFDMTDPRYYQTHIIQKFPRTGVAKGSVDQVTLRVRVRPMGLDVLQDLVSSGDLDPSIPNAMTTMDIGANPILTWTPATATLPYMESGLPYMCITTTSFNVAADKVPAVDHTKCSP
jgi:Cytochrome c554 and c-prime